MILDWHRNLSAGALDRDESPERVLVINSLGMSTSGSLVVHHNYCRALVLLRPKWRMIVLHRPDREDVPLPDLWPNLYHIRCPKDTIGLVGRRLWERRWLNRTCLSLGAHAYFAASGAYQPTVTIPQFVLVQDPSPYVFPPSSLIERVRAIALRRLWRQGVAKAACMGYASSYMRQLVIADAGRQEQFPHVIALNGVDESMLRTAGEPCPSFEDRQPVILSVSAYMPHKNFESIIRAFKMLHAESQFAHYRLRIVGRLAWEPYYRRIVQLIGDMGLESVVSAECDLANEDITSAYRTSRLFTLTSLCESFCIPAIESMAHGLPRVIGDCCALPEVVGEAGVLVPPESPQAIAEAWRTLMTDRQRYGQLQEQGRRRVGLFRWENTVKKWIDAIERIVPPAAR
ncbi:MAG: glycosyltransferase [Phycisphaerae bacterium]|jgi:glycosyltransferase involved in cell wall biosynthesis